MVRAGASKRGITTPSLIIHSENSRQEMSTQHAISLDKLPPTSNALDLKVRRIYYVAGLIWGQSLITTQGLPDHVRNWGWIVDPDHEQSQI